jgi:hypothetical protein
MAAERELRTFLRRSPDGSYRLETDDGRLLLRGRNYRELRATLERVLAAMPKRPDRVKILIGTPSRLPAHRSPSGLYAAVESLASIA